MCVCVCVCVCVCRRGNQAVMTMLQYLVSTSVLADVVGQWLQKHLTFYITRFGTCVRLITIEMSTDVK